ncbi:MAG: GNAT family N-acetyltransferase [Candidatus Bathyarchaeia archaeon]
MREGAPIRSFLARDGRLVMLRAPRWRDLDDMLEFINSLVEEGAEITATEKKTRDEEVDWLAGLLSDLEKDKRIAIAAEVDGRFIGLVDVTPEKGSSAHVGVLGIAIKKGYRDIGIGTEMMREAENQARRLGIAILTLDVFASNSRARHLYEKLGYVVVGCIPRFLKRGGVYIDKIIMAKTLPDPG